MPCGPKDGHSESVRVVLRCRPLNSREIDSGYVRTLNVDSKRGQVILKNPKNENESPREFTFDAVYDWNSNQADLYDETFRPLVDAVLLGFNGTIFAYGQTGTGKTYTMEGASDDAEKLGMIPRSFDHVFSHIDRSENCQYLVRASYLEIYQEEIRDLLNKDPQQRLELRERPDTGTYVKDLSSFVCKSVKEIEHVMAVGNSRRSVAATNMNEHSSRSHAICLVTVECSELGADGEPHIRVGKLSMVDLAGSERQTKTAASGERLKEATKINLSLSALGNIISALVDGKSSHIPYRDSKLTRLFQDSLGGNAKTVMVANIGPASYNYDETLSTLRYASRAKNIKNKPKINEDPKDALLREFQNEISKLKAQLRGRAGGGDKWRRRRCRDDSGAPDGDQLQPDLVPEDRLDQERARLEQERRNIEEDHGLIAEDRERLLQELRLKDQQLEREHQMHARLVDKIQSMESKLLSGGRNIADTTNQQQRQLELSRQHIADQKAREREMLQRIEAQEGSRLDMQQTYLSLQQEVEVKTKKLKKLFNRLQAVKRDILDASDDFMEERRELEEAQNTLLKELKLKCLVLENFVPCEERAKLLQRTTFDDDADCWRLAAGGADCRLARRPVSAAGARRPVSQYARLSGVLHTGTRYKGENVMSLELDVTGRTTRDYRGPLVAPRYQAALEAALSPQQSEISISAAPAAAAAAALRPRAKPSKLARLRPAKTTVPGADYPQSRGLVPK